MMTRYLVPLLIFFPVAILQVTIIPFVAFDQIAPNLIIILLVVYTLKEGQLTGMLLGFIFGTFYDLISGGYLGLSMLSMTLAAFAAGYFHVDGQEEVQQESQFRIIFVVFIAASINSLVFSLVAYMELFKNFVYTIFEYSLLPGIYTAAVSFIFVIFRPVRKMI